MARALSFPSFREYVAGHCITERRVAGIWLFAVLAVLLTPSIDAQNQQRGFGQSAAMGDPHYVNGNYYALVIGIDDYHQPLKQLKTAVNDAKAVGQLLQQQYGFQVQYLLDQGATRFNILDALSKYRNTLHENDSLLIYYAGHGYSDRDADKAYWLPVDADSGTSPNRIIADDLTTGVRELPSRHVLIVSDSCYSGGLSRNADEVERSNGEAALVARMQQSRSRTLMASGGDEPVSDSGSNGHSVFANAVLRALQREPQPIFTASDLFYSSIRQQVAGKSQQIPEYSIIRNSSHDEGDFVFVRTGAAPAPRTSPALNAADALDKGLALAQSNQYADALPLLTTACDGGSGRGCASLAWLYQNGKGVSVNETQAASYYRLGCDDEYAMACNNMGALYRDGKGVGHDDAKAAAFYRKACDAGYGLACSNLAGLYSRGLGVGKDLAQSIVFFEKACDDKEGRGCWEAGSAYEKGEAVKADEPRAASYYSKGCDNKDAASCAKLGRLYLQGTGVTQSQVKAAELTKKSCDLGLAAGCETMSWMYQGGVGVDHNPAMAGTFLRKACDGGIAAACSSLGLAYEQGNGVAKDLTQAATFYRKGCDGGDKSGCTSLKRLKP
jgi:TPR repeat protein